MELQSSKVRCSITIFCSIALLLIISMLFSLTEMCRMRVNKLYMQVVADSATDSLFSLYHRKLWDNYRLFGLESFDDNILKYEYMNFINKQIKDSAGEYINNFYISKIGIDDIVFNKENVLDKTYLEDEILSYMKYGVVNTIIKFAGRNFNIDNEIDKENLFDNIKEVMKKHNNSAMYQNVYKKYFNFKNDIAKLEKYARNLMSYVDDYNTYAKNSMFSTTAGANTAGNNYDKMNNMERKLYNIQKDLDNYVTKMNEFRETVRSSKSRYEGDKEKIEFDREIDEFIISEYEYFESYVDENSDMNKTIDEEYEMVNGIYPTINYYKDRCNDISSMIESLNEEKREINRDRDMDSEDKKEARNAINDELKELYEEAKEIGLELKDNRDSFYLSELILPVSKNGNLDNTSMFDRVLEFIDNGFLSLCLENDEISAINTSDIVTNSFNVDSANNMLDKILLSEYELNFFNFYNKNKYDMSTISESTDFEVERLICGKSDDKSNILDVVHKILLMREGCNILYLYSDASKRAEARAFANLLFWVFSPIVVEAMFIVILSTWALCQSFVDVYNLLHEKNVPFIHDESTFSFSIENITNMTLLAVKNNNKENEGMNYVDYLRILLMIENQNVINGRMAGLIEYNIKKTQDNYNLNNMIFGMDIAHTFHSRHYFTNFMFYRPDNVKLDDEYKMSINTYYDYIE